MSQAKTFCIYPWVHLHLNTDGGMYPCCVGWTPDQHTNVGHISKMTFEEAFNAPYMKQLRVDMLAGVRRDDACCNCYEREDAGFTSAREGANRDFADQVQTLIDQTLEDGYLPPSIKSWDIRYSNLCNLKCRSCGSTYSTMWGEEMKLKDYKIFAIPPEIPDPLADQYTNVEKIYFAGGEPLIMPEHFALLTKLIEIQRAKNVILIYNSNLTILNYAGSNLLELWSHFKHVSIGVSLDAVGPRAEYIRKGTRWSTLEKNLLQLVDYQKRQKNFDFFYSPTVSLFNVNHLPDMHKYLIEHGLALPHTLLLFNILLDPSYYNCRILPTIFRQETHKKIEDHVKWCVENNVNSGVIEKFKNIQEYMLTDINDANEQLQKFIEKTNELDTIRNENFNDTFPEYKGLL